MKNKRIFINMHYMEIGGAERALLGLLNAIDMDRYDVDLFLNQHTGAFLSMIPEKVNLLPEIPAYSAIERPMKDIIREGHWAIAVARLLARFRHGRYTKKLSKEERVLDASIFQYVACCVAPFLPSLYEYGEYDLAISFLQPHNIVLEKVCAKKKVAWIHTDYSTISINTAQELAYWGKFDKITSISNDCTNAFIMKFPSLKKKIVEIENILSPTFVEQQAQLTDTPEYDDKVLKICSVGRISHAKNFDNLPEIAAALVSLGVEFKWYVVGPGDAHSILLHARELGVEHNLVFLGARVNPYPYIKNCDIYLQPSRYEGKSVTVREAQMLRKPIIITNYPTASSQIQDEEDGVICGMSNHEIATAIYRLSNDKQRQQRLIDYLRVHDYGNEGEITKIYELI